MSISKFAPLFVDVAGQGLIIPILNTLILDPGTDYLRAETPQSSRHFYYGLVIGVFYLSWFLGASITPSSLTASARKHGVLICLAGALIGYVLTILAIALGSLWLMALV